MTEKELKFIIEEGEGYKIEFKEALTNLDKELVAFANSSGGKIFLGIADNKEIKGISISNKLKSQIQDIANNCKPKTTIKFEEFKNILIINVDEGDDKPYECSGGFYKRIGPNSQKMNRNELIGFCKTENKIRFDELNEPRFKYPKDFDKNKLNKFLDLSGLSKSINIDNILTSLSIAEKQGRKLNFNNSGILFFSQEPQHFIPWSVFTVVLFKDKNGTDVIDRKEIIGSLFEIVEQVMDFVRLYAKVAYKFTGQPQREEIYEYPFKAVREAVINSVMHKDYFEHGHNNILKFFPDRIQIENIWVKPKNFILGKTIFRRNQLIADLFSRIHYGEKLGSGMQRMKDICKTENSPYPKVDFTETHFYITFKPSYGYLDAIKNKDIQAINEINLNDRQKKAVEYVKVNGKITNKEYSSINNVGHSYAHQELVDITKKKIFKSVGKGRALYYTLNDL